MTVNEYLEQNGSTGGYLQIGAETPLPEVVKAMILRRDARVLFVADREERIVGVVTPEMLARHHFGEGVFRNKGGFLPGGQILGHLTAETAEHLMERRFVSCTPEEELDQVGHRVAQNPLSTVVPVVDDRGKLAAALEMLDVMERGCV